MQLFVRNVGRKVGGQLGVDGGGVSLCAFVCMCMCVFVCRSVGVGARWGGRLDRFEGLIRDHKFSK